MTTNESEYLGCLLNIFCNTWSAYDPILNFLEKSFLCYLQEPFSY